MTTPSRKTPQIKEGVAIFSQDRAQKRGISFPVPLLNRGPDTLIHQIVSSPLMLYETLTLLERQRLCRPERRLQIGENEVIGQNNHELLAKQQNTKPGA